MKKSKQKITAVIISLAMLVTMIPSGFAFADDTEQAAPGNQTVQSEEGISDENADAIKSTENSKGEADSEETGTEETGTEEAGTEDEKSKAAASDGDENPKAVSEKAEVVLDKPAVSAVIVTTKAIKVTWGIDTKCDGYKIVIAENSSFSKNKQVFTNTKNSSASRIIRNLSKYKRYYIRVCEYKTVTYIDPETEEPVTEIVEGKYSNTVSLKYLRPWNKCNEIKHACGQIGGKAYTNSLQALKKSLLKNSPAIEIDFDFTSDGKLVCTHEFDGFRKTPTYKKFMAKKVNGRYTPMTAETALKLMAKRYNSYLVLDCKGNAPRVYREINRILVKNGLGYYRPNVVPQIYYAREYKSVKKIYNYKNWIFTTYKMKMKSLKSYVKLMKYCKKRGIKTITIPKERAEKEQLNLLNKVKFMVGIHTVKTLKEYKKYRKAGGKFIYSDL